MRVVILLLAALPLRAQIPFNSDVYVKGQITATGLLQGLKLRTAANAGTWDLIPQAANQISLMPSADAAGYQVLEILPTWSAARLGTGMVRVYGPATTWNANAFLTHDGTVGLLGTGGGALVFSPEWSERMRVVASSGNVLVGTATDSGYRFDVNGNSRISGTLAVTGTITGSITGNAGTVTNGVYTSGSYSDPAWLILTKSKVGLSNVENTALSTWAGTSNITTVGTLAAGTIPWARLSNIPAVSTFTNDAGYLTSASLSNYANKTTANTFTAGAKQTLSQSATTAGFNLGAVASDPSSPVQGDLWLNTGAFKVRVDGTNTKTIAFTDSSITGNAGTVTNGVYTTGSYSDPAWLTLSKAKVGLGNVENTALSTWVGSTSITTVGTLSAGTVPWARLSGVPSYARLDAANTYTAGIKSTFSQSASTAGFNLGALSTDPSAPANGDVWVNGGIIKFRNSSATKTMAFTDSTITGNAANVTGTVAVGNGGTGQTTAALAYAAFVNSQPHQINFVYGGSATTAIDATTVNNVWRAHAYAATLTEVACWTDAGTVTLAIKDSAGNMVTSATLACSSTGASTTSMNTTYSAITSGEGLGFTTSSVSGVKNLSVSIKYTRAY